MDIVIVARWSLREGFKGRHSQAAEQSSHVICIKELSTLGFKQES